MARNHTVANEWQGNGRNWCSVEENCETNCWVCVAGEVKKRTAWLCTLLGLSGTERLITAALHGAAFLVGRYCLAFLTANNRLPAYSVSHPCPPPFSQPSVISGHALSVVMSVCLSLSVSVSVSLTVCLSVCLSHDLHLSYFALLLLCLHVAKF